MRVYNRLLPVEPTEHNCFSEMARLALNRPSKGPENPLHRLPEAAFSDASPFLRDNRNRFLEGRRCRGYPDGRGRSSIRIKWSSGLIQIRLNSGDEHL